MIAEALKAYMDKGNEALPEGLSNEDSEFDGDKDEVQ